MTSQAVADLLWAVNSPPLIAGLTTVLAPEIRLTEDQVDSEKLDAFLGSPLPHRVGRYFEALVEFWLGHVRELEIVGAGVQVLDGKRTIGEVDFLFRDEHGTLTHWEAAIKFFLHYERERASDFPGPNANDDFESKTTKLFEQQLQLSKTHFPDVSLRGALVKGMFFYRDGHVPAEPGPLRMNPTHLRGRWMAHGQLDPTSDLVGCIAHKPHWLAPQVDAELQEWSELCDSLSRHFDGAGHPLMVSLRDPETGLEVQRLFVVSDTWPTRKSPRHKGC